jgi:hypothetical protein
MEEAAKTIFPFDFRATPKRIATGWLPNLQIEDVRRMLLVRVRRSNPFVPLSAENLVRIFFQIRQVFHQLYHQLYHQQLIQLMHRHQHRSNLAIHVKMMISIFMKTATEKIVLHGWQTDQTSSARKLIVPQEKGYNSIVLLFVKQSASLPQVLPQVLPSYLRQVPNVVVRDVVREKEANHQEKEEVNLRGKDQEKEKVNLKGKDQEKEEVNLKGKDRSPRVRVIVEKKASLPRGNLAEDVKTRCEKEK